MLRTILSALVAVVLMVGVALAEEVKGKFVKFDSEGKKLTVKVDDKDKEFTITDDTKIKVNDKEPKDKTKALGALGKLKADTEITIVTDKKDGKDVVTEIKYEMKKKDK
jgi:hypothetical protein